MWWCQFVGSLRTGCPLLLLRTLSADGKVVARDAKEMPNTQDTRTGFVSSFKVWEVLVISCEKEASFLNRWKIISIYLVTSLKTEQVCACCYFCRMVDLTKHFTVKQKSIRKSKSCKRCYAWSLGIKQDATERTLRRRGCGLINCKCREIVRNEIW